MSAAPSRSLCKRYNPWWVGVLLIALLMSARYGYAQPWQHWKTQQQISVDYRTLEPSGLTEIRADTTLTTTLSAFINLLRDTEKADTWIDRVKSVDEVIRYSETDSLVETHIKGFFMVQERWVLTRSTISQDAQQRLTLEVANDYRPSLRKPGIQVKYLKATWTLTPLADGRVHIRYQGVIDPAGKIPRWIVRDQSLQSTLNTFVRLRSRLQRPEYQRRTLPFIVEPEK
ncbi:MAG: hypothetical protein GYB21_09265 [Oceanospirillales bacterium]|nr:hypothetical protein [Oceanospirillales bacterium]